MTAPVRVWFDRAEENVVGVACLAEVRHDVLGARAIEREYGEGCLFAREPYLRVTLAAGLNDGGVVVVLQIEVDVLVEGDYGLPSHGTRAFVGKLLIALLIE